MKSYPQSNDALLYNKDFNDVHTFLLIQYALIDSWNSTVHCVTKLHICAFFEVKRLHIFL